MRKSKNDSIDSMSDLARVAGRDRSTVSRWLRRPDWPFPKRPPFKRAIVPEILRWVADNLIVRESNPVDANDETAGLRRHKLREEIRKLNAQCDASEAALAQERGALLDAAEVRREWSCIRDVIRAAFTDLAHPIALLAVKCGMPSEAAREFQAQATTAVREILHVLDVDGVPGSKPAVAGD